MQRSMLSRVAAACILALAGLTGPAGAAVTTFVSQTGNDANSCTSPAAPCRNLIAALTKTDAGGLIQVAPGEYSSFTIAKAVEIIADSGRASINNSTTTTGSVTAAIIVNAAGPDDVRIRGFTIDRHGAAGSGIGFVGQGTLYVEDCTLVNNAGPDSGIAFVPFGVSELYVSDSVITGGTGNAHGILVKPTGSGTVNGALDNVRIENQVFGIAIDGRNTTGSNTITIRNSIVAVGSSFGIFAADSGNGVTNVVVEGSTAANNGTFGLAVNGANVTLCVSNSTITENGTGLAAVASGKLISHGGNLLAGNTTQGAFTQTLPSQ